ncbi:MAG: hypothetical protein KC586_06265, partial [Myxococcales bacterium]|nr:hypothetical protein [Myxococcales bacterium]
MGFFDRFERFLDDVLFLPDDLRESLATADSALEAELFQEASELYRDILRERALPRAFVGLAHARRGLGDAEGTLEALIEARRLLPEDGELAMWTARTCGELGRHTESAVAARDAARLFATEGGEPFAEACTLAAFAEWHGGRPDRAARELRKALASAPTPERRALLVEALGAAGLVGAARSVAATMAPDELPPPTALRVGRVLVELGAADVAQTLLEGALAGGAAEAGVWLARLALGRGDVEAAELHARRAVATGVGGPALVALGDALVRREREEEAAQAWLAASEALGGEAEVLRRAAQVAPAELLATWLERADLGALPEHADLRAFARGEDVDDEPHTPRGWLARAHARLEANTPADALTALDAWDAARGTQTSAADERRAAELRRRALRASWRAGEDVDLAAAIDAVGRFADEHALPEVARRARSLRDELDRPLLLGVLGEFNAGKSTLINAFIGAEVAPMGIVP